MLDEDGNEPIEPSLEEKARAEAEVRRQKILEKAGNRMDMVTGATTARDEEVSGTPANEAEPEVSKSDKLAAMRRRRFKKKAPSAKKDESVPDVTAREPSINDEAPKEKEDHEETKQDSGLDSASPKSITEPSTVTAVSHAEEIPVEEDGSQKKKYMGVAKMRRKMIKERQAKEEAEATNVASHTTQSQSAPVSSAPSSKVIRKVSLLPIAMHVLTVILLFLAGLDIGLQQSRIEYSSMGLVVHTDIVPRRRYESLIGSTVTETVPLSVKKVMDYNTGYGDSDVENEFEEQDTTQGRTQENLDPLFQVDLDKYTQGPGLFMMAGRFAVACHRANLSLFYYLPLSLLERLQLTVKALTESPPMLFLLALAIRQALGKLILGAGLPEIEQDDKNDKDVVGMVKNFVTSFVTKSFPTAVTIYDAWTHLRSDMYVILCGLFVGMAWHHSFQNPENYTDGISGAFNTHSSSSGISDEL